MIRSTTVGTLKAYRSSLNNSFTKLNSSRNTVLTQRNFNSYAEDPAAAAQSFQLRRSRMNVESQYDVADSVYRKYQSGWSSLETMVNTVDNETKNSIKQAALAALNDPTGDARRSLGKELDELADTLVQTMNSKYGENFIFAGADGQTVPFTWEDDKLCYRGLQVDDPANADKLKYLSGEAYYVDIGLGFKENEKDQLITSSGFNAALHGINFLGYGTDDEGDPKNLITLVKQMAQICKSGEGQLSKDDWNELDRLTGKLEDASSYLHTMHDDMDAATTKLKNNLGLLEDNFYTLQEQYSGLEDVDMAEAITSFVWAQYCYNAALKVGNSVLGQSLMDYMN